MTMRTSTNNGTIWGERSPQLEQRHLCCLPPAGGGGWDNFLLMPSIKQGHNLSASCHPNIHYNGNLVDETRGGRRVTRVVRVLRVDTNTLLFLCEESLDNYSCLPIYKTNPAISNTPRQTHSVPNYIFLHFVMVITVL